MIGGIGEIVSSTYSQTLNGREPEVTLFELWSRILVLSGPLLVSRTGDAG